MPAKLPEPLALLSDVIEDGGIEGLAAACHPAAIAVDGRFRAILPLSEWVMRFQVGGRPIFRRVGARFDHRGPRLIVAVGETDGTGGTSMFRLALTCDVNRSQIMAVHSSLEELNAPPVIEAFITAVDALNGRRILALFTADALVNDDLQEHEGQSLIRIWIDEHVVAQRLAIRPVSLVHRGERVSMRAHVEGDFDARGLPSPLAVTFYFTLRADRISQLIVLRNLGDL